MTRITRDADGKALFRGELLPPGPWHDEPDHEEFRVLGLAAIIHRNDLGAWCGYIAVPPGHPWHGVEYQAVDVDVHGGLTYSDRCQGQICHVAQPGEPDDVWWLGFDCNHSGDRSLFDLTPSNRAFRWSCGQYRTAGYVRGQVRALAEQVGAAAEDGRAAADPVELGGEG